MKCNFLEDGALIYDGFIIFLTVPYYFLTLPLYESEYEPSNPLPAITSVRRKDKINDEPHI